MSDPYSDDVYLKGKLGAIQRYLVNRDITNSIMLDAALAMQSAENGWTNDRRPVVGKFEQKWIHVYAEVNSAVQAMCRKVREWEYTHWMGFHPDDVKELLKLHEEWDHLDWERQQERGKELRDLFNPSWTMEGETELHAWEPYFARRAKTPIQQSAAYKSFSGETEKVKIMMGGSAGRMLVTTQDRYKKGDPKGVFDGAHITMIFDETAEWPRGGLQSLCATREEGLGLLQEAIDNLPELVEDNEIYIA